MDARFYGKDSKVPLIVPFFLATPFLFIKAGSLDQYSLAQLLVSRSLMDERRVPRSRSGGLVEITLLPSHNRNGNRSVGLVKTRHLATNLSYQ